MFGDMSLQIIVQKTAQLSDQISTFADAGNIWQVLISAMHNNLLNILRLLWEM